MATRIPVLTGILGLAAAAHAAPITYHFNLKVEAVNSPYPAGYLLGSPGYTFVYVPAVGDVYHGTLTFDDGVLATDGDKIGTPLDAFRLEIAGLAWDPDDAASAFRGFRGGPDMPAPSPVLRVSGGELTGLLGGVYALSDAPFVDFWEDGSFSSWAGVGIRGGLTVGTAAVPEPGSLALLLLGLGGIAGTAVRKRAARRNLAEAA